MATPIQTEAIAAPPPTLAPAALVMPKLRPKKKLVRRLGRDYSQFTRRGFDRRRCGDRTKERRDLHVAGPDQ